MSGKANDVNREIFQRAASFLAAHGAVKVEVFGSYARGEERPESDIDLLVKFSGRKSLLEIVKLERELSETLGIKVELLTEKAISPYIAPIIRKEALGIYG
ncbi:MAG: hypothetical protein CVT48_05620 [Thermoplasmata archaeon HGW-Thermoplasmata-1]|nr:MAG: hypothetical protein CVT48_05620 [Thermoplasmata archaeon HGW-Thermoplasmata-1]